MKDIIAKHNGKYKSQRDNAKIYYLQGSNYVDENGKVLFPADKIDENESKLFDRTTECFISTGSMFCEALYNAKIIPSVVDELAYKVAVIDNSKGKETRFHWSAHERFIDMLLRKRGYEFFTHKIKGNLEQTKDSIDNGFPVMCSIWIKPWYPSGRGHLVLIVGYREDDEGNIIGYIVNDPFGDCLSKYNNKDGEKVFYHIKEFTKMISSPDDKPRFMGRIKKT